MRISVLGGGPGGLYFALLMKRALPQVEVTVFERNRADTTYGWGVVFSDETQGAFEEADPESYAEIVASFRYWQEIETYHRGRRTVSVGHGFAALSRRKLLLILHRRCRELGVELVFEHPVEDLARYMESDLVVGADGANSLVRERLARHFRPYVDRRRCKFSWLGTSKPLDAFTFIFEETEHGLFQVHAYPFEDRMSTWIVECREEVWRRAGLDRADEEATVTFCERLFAEHLEGHRLLANHSLWRSFPTVQCETWCHGNVVLLGDAAHTAHFSVGSGTKLAMEDAISLAEAFAVEGTDDVPRALDRYENDRWVEVIKLQRAAQSSLEWFEESARYVDQHPLQLTFNLMTRSKRITYDNLRERDPELVAEVDRWFREEQGGSPVGGAEPPPLFSPFRLRGLELANRIVVSPMCQYSATDGMPGEWHLVHLGSRAIGGAGLVLTEMTNVTAEGRITPACTGLYEPRHVEGWRRIVDFVHRTSPAKIGLQLGHAGRKGSARHPWEGQDVPLARDAGGWLTIAPSPLPFGPGWPVPQEIDRPTMEGVIAAYARAAGWAEEAGFDLLELHLAHGYLLSSFLSPLCNRRRDAYGGSLENRLRFPLEVLQAIRHAWPEAKPISARITASDWMADRSGVTPEEAVEVARALAAAGCDLIDVSSGGNSPGSEPDYGRMYQVPFAERIRHEVGVPVMAVGAITGPDHANTVLAAGRTDLVAMARPHLRDPYLTLHAAERYGIWEHPWPGQYRPARPRPPSGERRPLRPYGEPAWEEPRDRQAAALPGKSPGRARER